MKKAMQTRGKKSYRLLAGMSFLSVLIAVLCGALVSLDACLSAVLCALTVVPLAAILSLTFESAAEIRREENEAKEIGAVSRKMPKRS
ncbi:MAG: hypothetical protein J5958_06230 [Clostridia bacterium]|nr:hypothetical protein [Clostridia bacterium]